MPWRALGEVMRRREFITSVAAVASIERRYRQLFFPPLFLVEFSTLSLLTLLPSMRVTAYACYAVAGMFAVFAIWAAFGFAFPSQPLPLALNVISKILCFVAAIMLFAWRADDKASGAGTR